MIATQGNMDETVVLGPEAYDEMVDLWRRAGLPAQPEGRDAPEAFRAQEARGLQRAVGIREDGRLIAVAILTHDGRKGWINRLAVDPVRRRQGCAAALLAEAERWFLQEAGVEVFAALIHADNEPSLALFDRAGYETIDVVYVRKKARPAA